MAINYEFILNLLGLFLSRSEAPKLTNTDIFCLVGLHLPTFFRVFTEILQLKSFLFSKDFLKN